MKSAYGVYCRFIEWYYHHTVRRPANWMRHRWPNLEDRIDEWIEKLLRNQ
jgi:hypothetical protein